MSNTEKWVKKARRYDDYQHIYSKRENLKILKKYRIKERNHSIKAGFEFVF